MKNIPFKKVLSAVLILSLSFLLCCGCDSSAGSGGTTGDKTADGLTIVNVALEAPLSGSGSWSGKAMNAGCQIALENMEDDFAALGIKLNLIVNDHQASSDVAATDITKDIELYNTPAVIATYTGPIVAMSSVAEKNKVVLINPLAMGDQLVGLNDWLYNICPSYSTTCEAMSQYLYKEQGIRKVVLLGDDSSTSLAQREVFADQWKKLGGTVALDVECETNTTDFLSVCAQIIKKQPECIIMCSADEDMQQREMLQFSQLGLATNVSFAMVGPGNKNFAKDFDYESFAIDVRAYCPDQVVDRYNEAYVVDGMEFSSLQYTIANFGNAIQVIYQCIAYCIDNDLEITGENLKAALDTIESFDIYGGAFTFMEGNTVQTPIDIYRVVRGEAEMVASYFEE
ncbi:MAG: ABC transporter substrate-binding protein [Anaerovoracaceae bacterium]